MTRPDIDSIRARATEATRFCANAPVRASCNDVPVLLAYVVEVERDEQHAIDVANAETLRVHAVEAERDAALSRVAELEGLVSALRCPPSLRHLGADALAAWMLGSG